MDRVHASRFSGGKLLAPSAGGQMGIRFYCPNGHRLNVKDFLAGKRGICPHCEARFRIPRESEVPKGSPKVKPGTAAERNMPIAARRRSGSAILQVAAVHPASVQAATESTAPEQIATGQAAAIDKPAVSVRVKSDEEVIPTDHDPIEESPESIWYVRPPSGGQYGPAKGEVVRRWIAEGRVSADSLVWREGWAEWRLAGPIFPSLAGLNAVATKLDTTKLNTVSESVVKPRTGSAGPLPAVPESRQDSKAVAKPISISKSKSKLKIPAGLVVGLVLLIVTLATGLITVLVMKS
jgi:hypothetical protein